MKQRVLWVLAFTVSGIAACGNDEPIASLVDVTDASTGGVGGKGGSAGAGGGAATGGVAGTDAATGGGAGVGGSAGAGGAAASGGAAGGAGAAGAAGGGGMTAPCFGGKTWSAPALIESDDSGPVYDLTLAGNSSGSAMVIWDASDGTLHNVWSRRFTAGTGWGAVELAEQNAQGDARARALGMSENGDAVALWQQGVESVGKAWAARHVPGSGWGADVGLQTVLDQSAIPRGVALDASGAGFLVWTQLDVSGHSLWAANTTASGFGTAVLLEALDTNTLDVAQGITPTGAGLVTWTQNDGTRNRAWSASYAKATGFAPAVVLESTTAGSVRNNGLAVASNGNALAFWSKSGTPTTMHASRFVNGVWSDDVTMLAQGPGTAFDPDFGFAADGSGHLVWQQQGSVDGQGQSGVVNVLSRKLSNAGSWEAALALEASATAVLASSRPRVVVDGAGNAIAVWVQKVGVNFQVWTSCHAAGTGWLGASLLTTEAGDASDPQVVLDANGNATAVWMQPSNGHVSAWYSRLQ